MARHRHLYRQNAQSERGIWFRSPAGLRWVFMQKWLIPVAVSASVSVSVSDSRRSAECSLSLLLFACDWALRRGNEWRSARPDRWKKFTAQKTKENIRKYLHGNTRLEAFIYRREITNCTKIHTARKKNCVATVRSKLSIGYKEKRIQNKKLTMSYE